MGCTAPQQSWQCLARHSQLHMSSVSVKPCVFPACLQFRFPVLPIPQTKHSHQVLLLPACSLDNAALERILSFLSNPFDRMRLLAAAPWAREALQRAPASGPPVVLAVARDAFQVLFRQPAHRRLERAKAMEVHLKGTGVEFLYSEDQGPGFMMRCNDKEG